MVETSQHIDGRRLVSHEADAAAELTAIADAGRHAGIPTDLVAGLAVTELEGPCTRFASEKDRQEY